MGGIAQAAIFSARRAAFAPSEESKRLSSHPLMLMVKQVWRAGALAGLVWLFVASTATTAHAQFTLTPPAALQPPAVSAGESASAEISLGGSSGPVTLSCTVTGQAPLPSCEVSPSPDTPDATLSLTVTTSSATLAGQYVITVTGTDGTTTLTTTPLYLQVVSTSEFYTLTVSKPVSPSTVSAGGGATATITITPIGSYSGTVALSCLSITPIVTAAPFCSFQSTADSSSPVVMVSGTPATATLTISTYGTQQTMAEVWSPRIFYGLWLAVPGLALVGIGRGRKLRGRLLGLFLLVTVAGSLLMLPSCSSTNTKSNNSSGLVTPKDTYTIMLTGADQSGNAPSNTSTNQASVTLTVN
jgi:hypothetical protein